MAVVALPPSKWLENPAPKWPNCQHCCCVCVWVLVCGCQCAGVCVRECWWKINKQSSRITSRKSRKSLALAMSPAGFSAAGPSGQAPGIRATTRRSRCPFSKPLSRITVRGAGVENTSVAGCQRRTFDQERSVLERSSSSWTHWSSWIRLWAMRGWTLARIPITSRSRNATDAARNGTNSTHTVAATHTADGWETWLPPIPSCVQLASAFDASSALVCPTPPTRHSPLVFRPHPSARVAKWAPSAKCRAPSMRQLFRGVG